MSKEVMIINVRESVIASWLKDIVSISLLLAGFYFNYHYLGNSLILQMIFSVGLIVYGFKYTFKRSKTFTNKTDALNHVEELFKD